MSARFILLLFALSCSPLLNAEELKYIDLSSVRQRTDLRHPPAPSVNCHGSTSCVGAGFAGMSVADGAPDVQDPHALGVYLVRIVPTDINPSEPIEAEFKVLNTGRAPIEIPVWPHLSDLQPSDESLTFTYLSLGLGIRVSVEGPDVFSLGSVELFGSSDDARTVLTLRPGEWIRIRANVKLSGPPQEPRNVQLRGSFWLRSNTFHPGQGGSFTEVRNLYPNVTPTPSLPAHILGPSSQTKQ